MGELRCPECNTEVGRDWMHCPNDGTRLGPVQVEDTLELIRKRFQLPSRRTMETMKIPAVGAMKCPQCDTVYPEGARFCSADSTALEKLIPESNADHLIGQIVGGTYQILSVLGEGGNSRVYKARHVILERAVAVKIMHAGHAGDDDKMRRFLQESRAISSLNHPNIVTLFDFGLTDDGRPFFVMDFLEGVSLYDTIKQSGPLAPERAAPLFRQICDALNHAHQKGIVHRDVKPSNILLVKNGENEQAKLVDFGLAKIMEGAPVESFHLTQEGFMYGSPLYMSPEQCTAKKVDSRSDVYSLGVSMYEALCGEAPFTGDSIGVVVAKQLQKDARSLCERLPEANIPEALDRLVLKALKKDPADRHQTMVQMIAELDLIYGERKKKKTLTREILNVTKTAKLSILVVDDEEVSLLAYATALNKNEDFEVVGVAINGELAVQKAELMKPDIIMMDFELPVYNGADATRMIRAQCPDSKVLILSSHDTREKVLESFKAGATGYALKSLPGERLFAMIRSVSSGSLAIDDLIDEQVAYEAREIAYALHRQQSLTTSFSKVEIEILRLFLEGSEEEDICEVLKVTPDAFLSYKQNIMRTLNFLHNNQSQS